jgi:hypothetical protein
MERWNYGTLRSRPLAAPTDGPCPATTAPGCTPEWMRQPDQFDGKQATPNLGKHPTQGQQLAPGLGVAEVGKVVIVFVAQLAADMTGGLFVDCPLNSYRQ